MASKCYHENDVGSLVFDRSSHPHHHHHFRLWNSFSTASFRRKLIATLSCGGGGGPENDVIIDVKKPDPKPTAATDTRPEPDRAVSEKLSDLLNIKLSDDSKEEEEEEDAAEVRRKEERLEELRAAVRKLQREEIEERENGAKLVRQLAKEDGEARSTMAMLGAIPPLVGMLDDGDDDTIVAESSQIEALYALLNLGIGNDLNKAAIVQAGAVHKMLNKIDSSSNGSLGLAISEAIVANFLALSALDSNKSIIGNSGAIPFLVSIIEDSNNKCTPQVKQDSLKALYNLSILPSNTPLLLETNLITLLINTLGNMESSERILSILSNVVSTPEGRKAISNVPYAFPILIDVLNWTDSPGCQEKASYVLMVMAHKSFNDRRTMIEAGIGSSLLELTLLGTTLAQKRASRILECLRVYKGKQVSQSFNGNSSAVISSPISGYSSSSTGNTNYKEDDHIMSEEKKAVKQLVQQSLQNNMRRIVKRANLPQDFVPSEHLKSLTVSSMSKSVPF